MYDRHDRPDSNLTDLALEAAEVARIIGGSLVLEAAVLVEGGADLLTRLGLRVLGYQQAGVQLLADAVPELVAEAERIVSVAAAKAHHPAGNGLTA